MRARVPSRTGLGADTARETARGSVIRSDQQGPVRAQGDEGDGRETCVRELSELQLGEVRRKYNTFSNEGVSVLWRCVLA